jgi:phage terminase large subunit-like protein
VAASPSSPAGPPDALALAAEILDPREAPSRWYCDREDCDGKPHDGWEWKHARAAQRPPPGQWLTFFLCAGRGAGKTRASAEWVIHRVRGGQARRVALVGRTASDIREVMIWGEGGIMACSPPDFRPTHQIGRRRLVWPNGAEAYTYTAVEPALLRGPEHDAAWCDELSSWPDAHKGDRLDTAWNNLMLGLRLGTDPRVIVSTTPKPNRLTRELYARPTSIVRHMTTYDNVENLAPQFKEEVIAAYEGTRVGRQELMGELLTDVQGALWDLDTLDRSRAELVEG